MNYKGNLYVSSIGLTIVLLVFSRIKKIIMHHVKRSMLCVKKVLCGKEDASQLARRQLACQLFLFAEKFLLANKSPRWQVLFNLFHFYSNE